MVSIPTCVKFQDLLVSGLVTFWNRQRETHLLTCCPRFNCFSSLQLCNLLTFLFKSSKPAVRPPGSSTNARRASDAIYDPVPMDMSEVLLRIIFLMYSSSTVRILNNRVGSSPYYSRSLSNDTTTFTLFFVCIFLAFFSYINLLFFTLLLGSILHCLWILLLKFGIYTCEIVSLIEMLKKEKKQTILAARYFLKD